jgi:UDPglucose 6-dehydrogenase
VGLVTAACLAELGHEVRCLEIDTERLLRLHAGELPIHEAGLDTLMDINTRERRLTFTGSFDEAITGADVAFIAVPTPPAADGTADTSHVFSALGAITDHALPGLVVAIKSTVPVGTGDLAAKIAAEAGKQIELVSNPEFLRQGTAVSDFMEPDRVVVGASSQIAAQKVARLFAALEAPVVYSNRRSAELAKYASNALLASRISFMNEISDICEVSQADVVDVARIVGLDRRIGSSFLSAGLGWGGSCFPKDVLALKMFGELVGRDPKILRAVYDVNFGQRKKAAVRLIAAASRGQDPTVAILGLAFKPETDDVRGSPAIDIATMILAHGIRVQAHDPVAMDNARRVAPEIEYVATAEAAVTGAHAVLLATEWKDYLRLDWTAIKNAMSGSVIVDGRNVLNGRHLQEIGFEYHSFGRTGDSKPGEAHPVTLFDLTEYELGTWRAAS